MFEGLLLPWQQIKSKRSYGFLITKELIFWLPNFGFFFHFSASLNKFQTDLLEIFATILKKIVDTLTEEFENLREKCLWSFLEYFPTS